MHSDDLKDVKYTLKINGNVAIFTHDACTIHFEEKLEKVLYRIKDPPFEYTPSKVEDFTAYAASIYEETKPAIEGRKIIVLRFNELAGLFFHQVLNLMENDNTARWLLVSFFDSDETISHLGKKTDLALQKKVEMIDRMLLFPYIKRLETPPGGLITRKHLEQLYLDNFFKERIEGTIPIAMSRKQ